MSEKRSPKQILLDVAHSPAFPFFILKFVKSNRETFVAGIELETSFYDFLVGYFGADKILLYSTLVDGRIESWTPDMQLTFRLMSKLELISSIEEWVVESRPFINAVLSSKPSAIEVPKDVEVKLTKIKEILEAGKILNEIEQKKELLTIAKDVANSGFKDYNSTIYRLAMMIYHSQRLTGEPAIKTLEDPGSVYLELLQNNILLEKYPFILEEFKKIPVVARTSFLKTFMSFIAGAYLYYSSLI